MKDEIITELWRAKDFLAEKYGYDLDRIVAAIRERERHPLTGMATNQTPDSPAPAPDNPDTPGSAR